MALSILNIGKTAVRDALKTLISHVGVSTDSTAFAAGQTALNPSGAGTNLIKAATKTDVDGATGVTFDATISINGDTEFTDKTIFTIGALNGATADKALSRTVRSQGIGVRVVVSDAG